MQKHIDSGEYIEKKKKIDPIACTAVEAHRSADTSSGRIIEKNKLLDYTS